MNEMNTGKVVLGVLTGVAVGAILGILFAPEKGSDTRASIAKKTSDVGDGIKTKFEDLLTSLNEKLESVKTKSHEIFENGKDKSDEIKGTIKSNLT
jgi:gas vesicle protein